MEKGRIMNLLRRIVVSAVKAIRNHEGTITVAGLTALFVYYLLSGDVAGVSTAIVMAGITSGAAIGGEPATLENVEEVQEGLLRSAVDSRVVKIRPASTPLDQISRWGGSRIIGSMKAEYYAVDNKPFNDNTAERHSGGMGVQLIKVGNRNMFSPSDTLLLPDVEITDADGKKSKGLVLYVTDVDREGLSVLCVNNYDGKDVSMPELDKGTRVIRMGRAAAELDVQTDQYEALPTKDFNYCQIFKTQIEQSTLMRLSNKEVQWSLSDMEESAIVDMRLAMEKSFLFGCRCKIDNPDKNEPVYLTGGIWNQAAKEFEYIEMGNAELVDLCREAFTGSGGSSRKVLIGGSRLIASLNKLPNSRITFGTQTKVCWGIDFTEIVTHFGSLYVAMSEIFDQCNHAADGMIIDPEYIVKYSHIPFTAEKLDLRKSGQRNTEAVVITEASCLVLRYPTAHMRIVNI